MLRFLFVVLVSFSSFGCAHWYSEERDSMELIVVTNKTTISPSCRRTESLEGKSCFDATLARLDLKRKAADARASHLLITETDFGFWCQVYRGEAYRCPL